MCVSHNLRLMDGARPRKFGSCAPTSWRSHLVGAEEFVRSRRAASAVIVKASGSMALANQVFKISWQWLASGFSGSSALTLDSTSVRALHINSFCIVK